MTEDEVKCLREETQASLKAMDSMLLTKTERYVIGYARENGIDNDEVRGCLIFLIAATNLLITVVTMASDLLSRFSTRFCPV